MDAKKLKSRLDKAKADRDQWRDLLEDAYDHIIPSRNNFSSKTEGDEENSQIYDETAPLAIPRFANRMQRSLFPEGQEFALFKAGSDFPDEEKQAVDDQLEEYAKAFYSDFNQSNFHTEINPAFIDCGISTGVIQIDEEPITSDKLYYFSNIPLDEIAFERPVKGRLVNVWRTLKVVAERILDTWPRAKIPTQLQKIIDKTPLQEVDIAIGQIKEKNVFHIYVMWEEDIIHDAEYNTQRLIPFRLNAFPKETYGRGPGILVLPAIKDVNVIQQLTIENAAIQVAGMYTGRVDSIFNPYTFTVQAAGLIPVSSNDTSNPILRKLDQAGDLSVSKIIIEERQESIRKAFFVDPMGDISDPIRSATEQTMRMQEFLKDQGAAISRLRTELVVPVILACIDIARGRGKLPKDIKVDGKSVKIEHNTTLTQAERQDDFQSLMTWMQSLLAVLPQEAVMGLVNVEELPEGMADMLNVSSKYIRSDEERKQLLEQAQSAMNEQADQASLPAG